MNWNFGTPLDMISNKLCEDLLPCKFHHQTTMGTVPQVKPLCPLKNGSHRQELYQHLPFPLPHFSEILHRPVSLYEPVYVLR